MAPEMAPATQGAAPRTAQGTERRASGRGRLGVKAGRAAAAALLFLGSAALLPAGAAFAQPDEDTVLDRSGIRYPDGFELNTVGILRGKTSSLERPEQGPVRFQLDTGRETYTVLASPKWFWDDLGFALPDGTEVTVRGSKSLGTDGGLYVVAQELSLASSGQSFALRDARGSALWKGARGGPGGARGGFGGTRGGGGGPGGAGRGRGR